MLRRYDRHACKPRFRLVQALDHGKPVAMAYGFPLPADTAWWNETLEPVPDEVAFEDQKRTFAVFELAVAPKYRREYLATRLHEALLQRRPEQRRLERGPGCGVCTGRVRSVGIPAGDVVDPVGLHPRVRRDGPRTPLNADQLAQAGTAWSYTQIVSVGNSSSSVGDA